MTQEAKGIPFPEALEYLGQAARAYGMTRLSKETGFSRAHLYRALRKTGNPRFRTIWKVVLQLNEKLIVKHLEEA